MHTLFATLWSVGRSMRGGAAELTSVLQRRLSLPAGLRAESGISLIEVLISALLVALIGVAIFTGLAGATHTTANERRNAQATVIAQQDEERLRGLPVEELTQVGTSTHTVAENGMCVEGSTGAWKYWSAAATASCEAVTGFKGTAYTGAVFTVESSAQFVTASKEALTCETSGGTADYLETTSSVTWTSVGTHSPISQSSLVAVPRSGTLLVKVTNRNNEPVPGAAVAVTDPSTAGTATAQQTTPTSGCVIFGALAAGNAKVVASKGNWIAKNGKTNPEVATVAIKTTALAEVPFTLDEPGGIRAEFVNSSSQPVEGSAFVAFQTEMGSPSFAVGEAGSGATTAVLENLFPFVTPGHPPTSNKYTAYAGDCEKNNPLTVGVSGATSRSVAVEPGEVEPVPVELAPINVTVYQGTKTSEGVLAGSTSAKILNTECKGAKANNGTTVKYEHEVTINTAGALVQKYQPYAKSLELCVVGKDGANYYKNTAPLTNTAKAGTTAAPLFLASGTKVTSTTKC
jgi:Tfp pilus assembly protein PilV